MTDGNGNPDSKGANNNVSSKLPNIDNTNGGTFALSHMDSEYVAVSFKEGSGAYIALDFALETESTATYTVSVFFKSVAIECPVSTGTGTYFQDENGEWKEGVPASSDEVWDNYWQDKGILGGLLGLFNGTWRKTFEKVGKIELNLAKGQRYQLYYDQQPLIANPQPLNGTAWNESVLSYAGVNESGQHEFEAKVSGVWYIALEEVNGVICGTITQINA